MLLHDFIRARRDSLGACARVAIDIFGTFTAVLNEVASAVACLARGIAQLFRRSFCNIVCSVAYASDLGANVSHRLSPIDPGCGW